MVFQVWAHEQVRLNLQWLVLRMGGTDFLHCWVTDSIWSECAESLILSNSFHGSLLHGNNSLIHNIQLLLLGLATYYCES